MVVGSCCTQVLWIKQQTENYDLLFDHIPINYNNTSAINFSKNPIQYLRTKNIEIQHHFLRDRVRKRDIELIYIHTDKQLADIFTKSLMRKYFVLSNVNCYVSTNVIF